MPLPRLRRFTILVVAYAAVLYCSAVAYMYVFQRSFVFKPAGVLASPAESGLEAVQSEKMGMSDGTSVTVWRAAPNIDGAPTVLYFHGNSGNLSTRAARYRQILESGFGLYAPTYRGYAGSEGQPSETGLISDALEHFDRLSKETTDIVIHGESLGTGVATAVAAQRKPIALILEAPYTATVDVAAEAYPWLPVAFLMKDQFPSRERIGAVSSPVMIIHGTDDTIIPFEHGQALYEKAGEPKTFVAIDGAGHGDLWKRGLWENAQDFLRAQQS